MSIHPGDTTRFVASTVVVPLSVASEIAVTLPPSMPTLAIRSYPDSGSMTRPPLTTRSNVCAGASGNVVTPESA